MSINIEFSGFQELEAELNRLNSVKFNQVVAKQTKELLNRARASGGTPVDTGNLRMSSRADPSDGVMGYTASYGPHVEFGHRTRDGGYVQGQRFLQHNVDTQRPIYKQDLINAIRKERG